MKKPTKSQISSEERKQLRTIRLELLSEIENENPLIGVSGAATSIKGPAIGGKV